MSIQQALPVDLLLEQELIRWEQEEIILERAWNEFNTLQKTERLIAEALATYNDDIRHSMTLAEEDRKVSYAQGYPSLSCNHPEETKKALSTIYPKFDNGPFTALFIGVQYYGDNKFVESVQEAFRKICVNGGKLYLVDNDEKTLKELKKRIIKGKEPYAHLVETKVIDLTRGFLASSLADIEKYKANNHRYDLFMKDSLTKLRKLSSQPLQDLPKADFISSSLVIDQLFSTWKMMVFASWNTKKVVDSKKEIQSIELEMDQIMQRNHIQDIMKAANRWIYLASSVPIEMAGIAESQVLQDAMVKDKYIFQPAVKPLENAAKKVFQKQWIYVIDSAKYLVTGQIFLKSF
jgi:hypothetical protein